MTSIKFETKRSVVHVVYPSDTRQYLTNASILFRSRWGPAGPSIAASLRERALPTDRIPILYYANSVIDIQIHYTPYSEY